MKNRFKFVKNTCLQIAYSHGNKCGWVQDMWTNQQSYLASSKKESGLKDDAFYSVYGNEDGCYWYITTGRKKQLVVFTTENGELVGEKVLFVSKSLEEVQAKLESFGCVIQDSVNFVEVPFEDLLHLGWE